MSFLCQLWEKNTRSKDLETITEKLAVSKSYASQPKKIEAYAQLCAACFQKTDNVMQKKDLIKDAANQLAPGYGQTANINDLADACIRQY